MPDPPDYAALLAKHVPRLRFSALESYRPDAVEVMTERFDAAGASPHWLKRRDGHVIASTHPRGNEPRLTIGFLRPSRYGNRESVKSGDYLDIGGRDYVDGARIRHADPRYGNRIYGRVVTDAGGTWLQYWLYYFYNSKAFVIGEHEGDWELVQIRIGANGRPAEATFSQHSFGEKRPWARVKKEGPRPVVYVAVASHACYFEPGQYRFQRVFFDHALGDGESVVPTLVDITDPAPAWVGWPGRWGSTTALLGGIGESPRSPCKQEPRWREPSRFHKDAIARPAAEGRVAPVPGPPQPRIEVRREDDRAVVEYTIPAPVAGEAEPVVLVVSVGAAGTDDPPATYSFPLEALTGEIAHPAPLDDRAYLVRAVTVDATGMMSVEATASLAEAARAGRRSSAPRRGGSGRRPRRSARAKG